MTSVSGVGPSSATSYASSVESSLPVSGRMDMATLQTWLGGQVGKMWDKVGDATKGVDDRNKLQAKLSEWTRKADGGERVLASEVYEFAASLPPGSEKDTVLGLVAGNPSPEAIAAKEQEVATLAAKYEALPMDTTLKLANGFASLVGPKSEAQLAMNVARKQLETMKAPGPGGQALDPKNLSGSCKLISSDLGKANDLAMTTLQAIMASAQQAMSLTSNLMKASDESKSSVIRNMV